MTSDQRDPGSRQPRESYDPGAVDRVFAFVRWLHRQRLSNPLYYSMAAVMIPAYYALAGILNQLTIHHRDRLPPHGTGFFLLSNHISILDGQIISMMTFPRTYWYPSKAAFYGTTLRGLGYTVLTGFKSFPVRRGERDYRAMELIEDLLRRGESVLLFPEGTRSLDGTLGEGKLGVGKIIHDAQPMVVPTYLEGLGELLGDGTGVPRTGRRSHVIFGDPLELDDLYDLPAGVDASRAIVERVMGAIADLREELHDEIGGDGG